MNNSLKNIRQSATELSFVLDGHKYSWFGGFGAVLQSEESESIPCGAVRVIAGIPFYVTRSYPSEFKRAFFCIDIPLTYCMSWIPVESFDMEWVQEFKKAILLGS